MKILITVLTLILITGCGKSPLQKQKDNIVSGINGMESAKVFKTSHQSLSINWLSPINSSEEGHALLIVKQGQNAADINGQFKIFLWMPDMGHGSSPITINKIGTGLYDLGQIYFIMDGLWQLRIQLLNGSTVLDEQIFEYTL